MLPTSEIAQKEANVPMAPERFRAQEVQVRPPRHIETVSRRQIERHRGWQNAFAAERKDHRYYEVVEDTIHQGFDYRCFTLKDENGEICAVQPFFINDQDLLAGTSVRIRNLAGYIRRIWPRFMRMRTMMIGCAAGEAHLDAEDDAFRAVLAQNLGRAITDQARYLKTKLIVFKEFTAPDRPALLCLQDHGFTRIPSMPMTRVALNFVNFEEYLLNTLSRNMRSKLRRKYKASERRGSLEMRVVTDVTPFIRDIYPLYLAVFDKSRLQFEKLTPEYFCEIGRRMPDKALFFLWYHDNKIVAFNLCLINNKSICSEYIGFDYNVALEFHLYYIAVRDVMKWAIENEYQWYCSTALNYEPKYHLRHMLDPLDLYVKHTSLIVNFIMKRVLPFIEPTRYDEMLRRFANYGDLHAR
jgi:predicted N-acyltransferase